MSKTKKFHGPGIKVSVSQVSNMTRESIPTQLLQRFRGVLGSKPSALDEITHSNAHIRLKQGFGIDVKNKNNAPWNLVLKLKNALGQSHR